ncbi:MAG TPA: collagenase [Burkholderiaceae bacterium]
MRFPHPPLRPLALAGALLCAGTVATATQAPPSAAVDAAVRAMRHERQLPADPGVARMGEHVARTGVPFALVPPRSADDFLPRHQRIGEAATEPSHVFTPRQLAARDLQRGRHAKAGANTSGVLCSGSDFVGLSGNALISFIDAADLSGCMYSLYVGSVDEYRPVFTDANIITVSNTLKARAVNYAGNDSNHMMNLLSFLRTAGYWSFMSTTGDPANNIPPGSPTMMSAALAAMMQIIASPHFFDKTEDNAMFVSEVYKTAPSGWSLPYAPSAKKWIDQTTAATAAIGYWTDEAITAATSVFYYGQFQPDYEAGVANDISYATSFNAFLTRNYSLTGGDNTYMLSNSMSELIRFEAYPALIDRVRTMAVAQMPNFPVSQDSTIDVWIAAAGIVDTYDSANCSQYGTCNGQATVKALKLPIVRQCNSTYTIHSEAMTQDQLDSTCNSVIQETSYYHKLLPATKGTPVANDKNKTLELDVFDSDAEYVRFSTYLFGNDTNNGGIYLEGDPSAKGNQARFCAYRADWLADFEIWNLNHEFAHYLDGRFDMWGAFSDYPLTVGGSGPVHDSAVWWIEGFAEYMSYSFRRAYYADATSRAQTAPLALSDVMTNTYDSGEARVYNWGYLAVRYIIERQPNAQLTFLPMFRVGNYAGYSTWVDNTGTSLDGDFSGWLTQCVGGGDTTSSSCRSLGVGTKPLLTPEALGACNLGSAQGLQNGCSRAITPTGVMSYWIPTSTWNQTIFKLSQVKGGADVYAKAGSWASSSSYTVKGGTTGADLSLTLPSDSSGWSYVTVVPRTGFSSATLRGMYSNLPFQPGSAAAHP